MKKIVSMMLVLVLTLSFITGCGSNQKDSGESKGSDEKKVAYITGTGGLGDNSFNDLGYKGIQTLMDEGITCDVSEPTSIAEIEGIARNFAEDGSYSLIVIMGGDAVDSMVRVATDYPDQKFMMIDGMAGMDNVYSVEVNQNETGFLAGVYAGILMKEGVLNNGETENIVGAVGGMDIPLIRGILNGFECGVRYVNPDAKVLLSYVGDWSDPSKASELAQGMYEQGASMVFQAAGASGMGVIECAQKQGAYAIGYDGNQNIIAPDNMVGSAIRGVGDIIAETAHKSFDGTFEGGDHVVSLCDNEFASQILTDDVTIEIPETVIEQFNRAKEVLLSGEHSVPFESEEIETFISSLGAFE